ncbi:MAG: Bifunctional protein HldE [Verrucomicrobia subdivision 3 bacterium]|nr:Bifunctional protein HldE [Limisphaerales bacterium]MCS1415776.1 Bifunctional protein HldE [Limisphaerales bacterium]
MNTVRFQEITKCYPDLRIAVVGDFCLDRYFEIDPRLSEFSIETGLEVHNVTRVRTQPGAAGTILNNLSALGIGEITAIGFYGQDGEGWLLERALRERTHVNLDHFLSTSERATFTYSKPLVMEALKPPRELNRLDQKNWTQTPESVSSQICDSLRAVIDQVDAVIVMDQVDRPFTGVVTLPVRRLLINIGQTRPNIPILADSRQSLVGYESVSMKMNAAELKRMVKRNEPLSLDMIKEQTQDLAVRHKRPAFITLSERGIIGAEAGQAAEHVPCFPVTGESDIVGAGDAVMANLVAGLAAGATVGEAMQLAMAASSIVIHQLGTTGTATCEQILELFQTNPPEQIMTHRSEFV